MGRICRDSTRSGLALLVQLSALSCGVLVLRYGILKEYPKLLAYPRGNAGNGRHTRDELAPLPVVHGRCPAFVDAATRNLSVVLQFRHVELWCFPGFNCQRSYGLVMSAQRQQSGAAGLPTRYAPTLSYIDVPKCGSTTMRSMLQWAKNQSHTPLAIYSELAFGQRFCLIGRREEPCGFSPSSQMDERRHHKPLLPLTPRSTVPDMSRRTFYTFLRDPVQRFISGWMEIETRKKDKKSGLLYFERHVWNQTVLRKSRLPDGKILVKHAQGPGLPPALSRGERDRARVLRRLEVLIYAMEQPWPERIPMNEHLVSQTVFLSAMPLNLRHPGFWFDPGPGIHWQYPTAGSILDVIAFRLEDLQEGVKYVFNKHLGLEQSEMPSFHSNIKASSNSTGKFSYNDVPADMVRRICMLYRVDYCCLGLPLSPGCPPMSCE
mmetsp:Transcript_3593/g.7889  ORF Transcript_3593/g.7889 Transcript_3593/m.7889 type:complete len:434 (-) Transcript_3593:50-1351(-)